MPTGAAIPSHSQPLERDKKGTPKPDAALRNTENVPLKDDIQAYFTREVLPHGPDAWIDASKTKVGYEISFTHDFYTYTLPRPLEAIRRRFATAQRG